MGEKKGRRTRNSIFIEKIQYMKEIHTYIHNVYINVYTHAYIHIYMYICTKKTIRFFLTF